MLDLLIRDGLIVDGTGNEGFYGSVGIERDRIRIFRGESSARGARRTIDATSHVVAPGFIDMHAHSGLIILADPHHGPKVRQGVTTEVIGVDGNSYAPFTSQDELRTFVELNSGLDGNPPLDAQWLSVGEYLSLFEQSVAVNIAYLIGNCPLRISTTGWDARPALQKELNDMRALLREGMEEGAFGLSTGLDYVPGSYADTEEIIVLAREAARLGGIYHTHVRYNLGDRFLDPFREAIEIARQSGVAAHITHLYRRVWSRGGASQILRLVEDAREEGLDVTFDSYPYEYGSSRLVMIFPGWAFDGGIDRFKSALRSEDARARLRDEVRPRAASWEEMWLTHFKRPQNRVYEGLCIAEIAARMQRHEVDALCDLLLQEDLQTSYVATNGAGLTLSKFIAHPLGMIGSDGLLIGDYPSPRTYGTFPTILSQYVRDERVLALPDAIRKMTSFPAQRLGLPDRGLLRDGMKADIVVFRPDHVHSPATRTNPKQFPVGIEHVIVNGVIVVDGGRQTDALPGRVVRYGRSST
jgi:N-acyl-D-amino-acid deacylase